MFKKLVVNVLSIQRLYFQTQVICRTSLTVWGVLSRKRQKALIVFDGMTVAMISKLHSIFTDVFIKDMKLNISLVFIWIPKYVRLNTTHFSIMIILNWQKAHQNDVIYSYDIDFKDSSKLYGKSTGELYLFLVIDTNLLLDNAQRVRKNLLEEA